MLLSQTAAPLLLAQTSLLTGAASQLATAAAPAASVLLPSLISSVRTKSTASSSWGSVSQRVSPGAGTKNQEEPKGPLPGLFFSVQYPFYNVPEVCAALPASRSSSPLTAQRSVRPNFTTSVNWPRWQVHPHAFSTYLASKSVGLAHSSSSAVPVPQRKEGNHNDQQASETHTLVAPDGTLDPQHQPAVNAQLASAPIAQQGEVCSAKGGLLGLHCSVQALLKRCKGRLQGITRKVVLRTINRRVIRQIARRATIGIPILGFFFVSRLMLKDYARVKKEYAAGNILAARLFSIALACDLMDMMCGATIITALAHNNFGLGLAAAAAWQPIADKVTMMVAVTSFTMGISGEIVTLEKEEVSKVASEVMDNTKAIKTEPPKSL